MSALAPPAHAVCPVCAGPLPPGALPGHCPRCLVRVSFDDEAAPLAENEEPWLVLGDHELRGEIARGGMGIVYRARQRRLGREVAVKVLRGGEFAGAEAQARFRTEAAAAARLQHPGIVALHDFGEENGVLWFSMDLVPGGSLADATRDHPLPAREAAECVRRVAEAVQHAHENGVLHRDLKPSNILLTADGQPRVTDFGIARRLATDTTSGAAEITRTGQVLGSPGYAAPEQALAGKADARTDVYGLGALLYHLVTGRPPFQGPTLDSILLQLRENDPLPPRRLTPTVPRDLETICLHALAKEPAHRYATARDFADDLARFLDGRPIHARPASALDHAGRWCRRRPALAALLAVIVLGTAAAFFLVEKARLREREAGRKIEAANTQLNASIAFTELRLADELFTAGDSAGALGALARVLRRDPAHPVAGPRLGSALWHGGFALPLLMPFFAGAKVWHLQTLADSATLLVCTSDGPALWDAEKGERRLAFENDRTHALNRHVLSPDGRVLAGWDVNEGGFLSLWDMQTGRLLFPPLRHASWLNSLVFSPDSARVLPIGNDPAPRWLDAHTGQPVGAAMPHPWGLYASAASADGRLAATSLNGDVYLWDAATQQPVRKFTAFAQPVKFLRFAVDGAWIFAASFDGPMRCFRTADGEPAGFEMRHAAEIESVALSTDTARVVTASSDGTARVWALPRGEPVTPPLRHGDYVNFAAFSPDGRSVATCSGDNSARVWDAQTGRPRTQPLRHSEQPLSAAFSPDGATLFTAGADRIVQRWDTRPRSRTPDILPHAGRIGTAEWSRDGRFVASNGADLRTIIRDARTLAPVLDFKHMTVPRLLSFSPDARLLLSAPWGGVRVLGLGEKIEQLGFVGNRESATRCLAFSADGSRFAIGQEDGTALIFDTATRQPVAPPLRHRGRVSVVRFSPDGRTLLTCEVSPDGAPPAGARLWDAATGAQIGQPMIVDDDAIDAAFSPDGTLIATAGNDNAICIWDARTTARRTGPLRHERSVRAVVFSPDSRLLASASWDGTARLWDARTGAPHGRPMPHGDRVLDVAFSPDGRRLATASRDQTARLWDAATGLPLSEPFRHGGAVRRVRFDPRGARLLTVSDEDAAHLWDIPEFSGAVPAWLLTLSDVLAMEAAPRTSANALALVTKYRTAVAQALATPPGSDFGKLARRLFDPADAR